MSSISTMSRTPKGITEALTNRIESAGFVVFRGLNVDQERGDPVPCVTIHYGKEGDETVEHAPGRNALNLVIEYVTNISGQNPLDVLQDAAHKLKNTCIVKRSVDMPDYLEGSATDVRHIRTLIFMQDSREDMGIVQMLIRILY